MIGSFIPNIEVWFQSILYQKNKIKSMPLSCIVPKFLLHTIYNPFGMKQIFTSMFISHTLRKSFWKIICKFLCFFDTCLNKTPLEIWTGDESFITSTAGPKKPAFSKWRQNSAKSSRVRMDYLSDTLFLIMRQLIRKRFDKISNYYLAH
jgi:hypothetical protein